MMKGYNEYWQNIIRSTLKNASKILVVSDYLKKNILINGIYCKPVLIGNLINDDLFQIKRSNENQFFTIIFVSWFGYIKDNDTFFKSIKHLVEINISDLKVIVIGSLLKSIGENKENPLINLAKEYGVENYCKFYGFVSREQMCLLFNKADVYVSTSISETFGVSAGEALCCGLPIVATKNGGMEDFLTKENSVLVDIQDYEAIAKAILKIKNKEIIFNPMQQRKSIVIKYGKIAFKERLSFLYKELML